MSWLNDNFNGFYVNWNFATDSVFGAGNHGEGSGDVADNFFLMLSNDRFHLLDGNDMCLLFHEENLDLLDGTDWLLLDGSKFNEL